MNLLLARIRKVWVNIINSIAFYPVMMSFGFFLLALLMLFLEQQGVSMMLRENFPFLVITDRSSAHSLLTALIAGMISLTVFSFSMVMVLLNQAASNFSPRLLPGLITSKNHQIVLGTYLGTIIFCLVSLINVVPAGRLAGVPSVTLLIAMFLGILSLGMFVFFIHNISNNIQVSTMMMKSFLRAKKQMERRIEDDLEAPEIKWPNRMNWKPVRSRTVGYLRSWDKEELLEIMGQYDIDLMVHIPPGEFIADYDKVMWTSSSVDKGVKKALVEALVLDHRELEFEDFDLAIKHLTEIALKAMSPAIYDPGTASTAVDYLMQLFELRLKVRDRGIFREKEDGPVLYLKYRTFSQVLEYNISQLRSVCKSHPILMQSIIRMLRILYASAKDPVAKKTIIEELKTAREQSEHYIENHSDLKKVINDQFTREEE